MNPLLTTPGTTWTLQSTSPAIDAGVCIYGVNQTYNGAWPDIGAYQYAVYARHSEHSHRHHYRFDNQRGHLRRDGCVRQPRDGDHVRECHVYAGNASGSQALSISKTAYRTDNETVTIASGTNTISRALALTCSATGVISSSSGGYVNGATVTFGTDSGTTTSTGSYNISTIVGTPTMTISATGYRTDTEVVTLTTGTNTFNGTLGQLCTVTGTITSSAGGGLSGATVSLGGGDSAITNSSGVYTVTTITGSHALTITPDRLQYR